MAKLERVVRFFPGYNQLDKLPYGAGWHGMEIFFGITDRERGLSISFMTPWAPPDSEGNPAPLTLGSHKTLSYHSLGFHYGTKQSEDQAHIEDCWLQGSECWWHDSAAMQGLEQLLIDFVERGDDVVWGYLERKWERVWQDS